MKCHNHGCIRLLTSVLALLNLFSADSSYAYPGTDTPDCTLTNLVPIRREVYADGRIFDITHRITSDLPSYESMGSLGKFLWLPISIKNGSSTNNSEMKLPAHTGTHVDAPGHVFDHYFDAGFDVDTLDLEVLNGTGFLCSLTSLLLLSFEGLNEVIAYVNLVVVITPSSLLFSRVGFKELTSQRFSFFNNASILIGSFILSSMLIVTTQISFTLVPPLNIFLKFTMAATSSPLKSLLILLVTSMTSSIASDTGYCSLTSDAGPKREYSFGRIIDITHRMTSELPAFVPGGKLGEFLWLSMSMKNGSIANFSEMKLMVHTGTHVDAPGHVFDRYYEDGLDVDSLNLEVLNGPALLVDVPRDKNLTAEVMKSLHIPRGVRRVLFRTLNTDRGLMYNKAFDTSYVGFMRDGARWLVDNTDIKLVGIDYLSVAAFDDLIPSHLELLESKEIILVEGLKLDDVPAGLYTVHCLPLRLLGAEGSPIRCILIK